MPSPLATAPLRMTDRPAGYVRVMDDEAAAMGEGQGDDKESLLDELRQMPVGTADPNIIGEAGPSDVPPGSDPPLMTGDDSA